MNSTTVPFKSHHEIPTGLPNGAELVRFVAMSQPGALRVLLVEDSEEDAFFFERALRRTGLETDLHTVTDGAAAIEYLKANRPDTIFLDLKLPVLSGFEVLRWIEKQGFNPPLNVAVLSGSDQERDVITAKELNAFAYVVKPISIDRLKSLLHSRDSSSAKH